MMRTLAFCLAVTLFAYPASAQTDAGQRPAQQDWFDWEIGWTEGPPSYVSKWTIFAQNGQFTVCGIGRVRRLPGPTREVQRDSAIFVNDVQLTQNVRFFARGRGADLVGQAANCVRTGVSTSQVGSGRVSVSIRSRNSTGIYSTN